MADAFLRKGKTLEVMMALQCPSCRTSTFSPVELPEGPAAAGCAGCGGVWITLAHYFTYLASRQPPDAPCPGPSTPAAQPDSAALKLCPACRRFMRYYPVGHGLPFGVDRCNTCGGFWLNKGEWEALLRVELGAKLHFIPSDAWQAAVHHGREAERSKRSLEQHLGPDDAAELQRITLWLSGHPHRDEALAYLREHLAMPH